MMATRSIQHLGKPVLPSGAEERAEMKGTQVTETIKASGQMIPRNQAGHMTATDHVITTKKIFLAKSGPSTHEGRPFGFGHQGLIPRRTASPWRTWREAIFRRRC